MPFENYRITSPYGYRTDPISGERGVFHDGIDLVKAHKAPIEAFVGGKVLYAGNGVAGTGVNGYGNVVVIQDKNNSAHVYAHLDSVAVRKGQTVEQGDIVGRQGATGKYVTGSHLHYEVRKKSSPSLGWVDDPQVRTYNPTKYLEDYNESERSTFNRFTVLTSLKGYSNAYDAKDRKNDVSLIAPGTYYIYREFKIDDVIYYNISLTQGVAGSWINPADNIASRKRVIVLPATVQKWRIYPLNKAPIVGNEMGYLRPSKFGGLQYEILDTPMPHTYTIQTKDFGKVNIYGGPNTAAKFKER